MSSPAQIAANQANAELSTGPASAEGKSAVSKNALKTGLTGRTVLLPTDDAEQYAQLVESFRHRFNPVGDAEIELVQSLADTTWRLGRVPSLEACLFALGHEKYAALHPNEPDEQRRHSLIEAETFLAYERQLRNLQLQESRLRRNLEKDMIALHDLQQIRQKQSKLQLTEAAEAYANAIRNGNGSRFNPEDLGFEFSLAQIEAILFEREPQLYRTYKASRPRHEQHKAA